VAAAGRVADSMEALNDSVIFKPRSVPSNENDQTEDAYKFNSVSSEVFETNFLFTQYASN
jgi:hypothetical protein